MAAIAKQLSAQAGHTLTFAAASVGGDTVPCEDGTVLLVKNDAVAPITVTIVTPATTSGLAIADQTVVVANGTIAVIGPFGPDFVDSSDGRAHVTYSAVVTVTVACLHVG